MRPLTIVIPTFSNSQKYLTRLPLIRRVMISLSNQEDKDFDLVVVDNGSTDDVESLVRKYVLDVTFIRYDSPGHRTGARNRGAVQTDSPHIVFLDCDCIPWPTYTRNWKSFISREPYHIGNGVWYNSLAGPLLGDEFIINEDGHERIDYDGLERDGNIDKSYGAYHPAGTIAQDNARTDDLRDGTQVHSGNCCIYHQHLNDVGGFDEDFRGWGYEDTFLEYKITKQGIPINLVPMVSVVHQNHRQGADESHWEDIKSGERNKRLFEEKVKSQ